MTIQTIELNAGTGGAKVLSDAVTTVDGVAAPAGAQAQVAKMAHGAAGDAKLVSDSNPMPVTMTGVATAANQATEIAGLSSIDGRLASSLPLPTGAATSAAQTTGNASLSSIDGKLPALSGGSVPVIGPLTDTQLRASNVSTALAALVYPTSTSNSSSAQLASGASFTGTLETIQNLQAAQIGITCDQAYTVQINQYIDAGGTRLVSTDTFTRLAGVPLSENITLPGNYFNLVVTNNGGSATTTLRIDTTFGIMDTQPRALTNEGKFPVEAALPPALLSSYSVAGVITINTVLLTLDCSAYRSISVQCAAMGTTGVVTPEWSNDNTNWVAATIFTAAGASATTFNAAGLWTATVAARYLRLRLSTATTAGTTTLSVHRFDAGVQPWLATQPVSGTVAVTGNTAAAASADGLANPTIMQIGADAMLFNGATWDRARGNWATTTGDTGAKTVSVAGATQTNYNAAGAVIAINMGTVSGTTPTFTAQVQGSSDGGTTWYNIPGAVTSTINATGVTVLTVYPGVTVAANAAISYPLPRTWRLNYTIGGTTPSFTITNVQVGYIN